MRSNPNSISFSPALVVLALFCIGGCFFDAELAASRKKGTGKDASFRKSPKSVETIFRDVLP